MDNMQINRESRITSGERACLDLETIVNARDLGGLMGQGGRRVRQRRLYRSANPALGCAADLDKLHALQLDIVVDFRSPGEKSAAEAAFGERFRWLAVPVLDGSMAMDALMPRLRASSAAQMHSFMLDVYRDFPVRYRDAFGAFMRHAEAGKTLFFHCTAGKDRTGFASLLLLSALGVDQDAILANYLESNHWNQRFNDDVLSRAGQLGVAPEVMMPLLEVRPEYLEASMETIARAHGSVDRFLTEGLGIDVERLRGHYLA